MSTVNKVIIIGNVGRDPEFKVSDSGVQITNFSLATKERSNQGKESTEWHNIVCFGRTAEIARDFLKKGSKTYVEGRMKTREWEGKDGNKNRKTEVVTGRLVLLGGKDKNENFKEEVVSGNSVTDSTLSSDVPF